MPLQNIGRVHVGFPILKVVRTRATLVVPKPMTINSKFSCDLIYGLRWACLIIQPLNSKNTALVLEIK